MRCNKVARNTIQEGKKRCGYKLVIGYIEMLSVNVENTATKIRANAIRNIGINFQ